MSLLFKATRKELFELRNKLFLEIGIKALQQNGFLRSPFSSSWHGKNNLGDNTYTFCRLNQKSLLEIITVHISKDDRWIKTYLNIFELHPTLQLLHQLNGRSGIKFWLPPNSQTSMRLRIDDIKGIPLFNFHFLFRQHKLKRFYTRGGLIRRTKLIGQRIEKDLGNIDLFVNRWHAIHKPMLTDWDGLEFQHHAM